MKRALLLLALLTCAGPLQAQEGGDTKVTPRVVSELEAVAPGASFLVGVSLTIAPDWHVYWRNPGDSGLAPEVTLDLPEGLQAQGDWIWPTPQREVLPGDLLDFVHEGRLTLVRRVVAAKSLAPGTELKLTARASWLVCQEVCLPGEGQAALTLTVAAESRPAADTAAIQATLARAPHPAAELNLQLEAGWEGAALVLRVPGASKLTWFPLTPEEPVPNDLLHEGQVQGERIAISYPAPQPRVTGVLVVERDDKTYRVAVEVPAADTQKG